MQKSRLLRITTVPESLAFLLRGQFSYMSRNGFDVWTCSASGEGIDRILSEGAKHHSLPFTRTVSPLQDLVVLVRLILWMRKLKPDIVHTHTPKAGLLGMMAAKFCGVPVRLHTVAGLPLMEKKGFLRQLLIVAERITYACAHRVYPNSMGLMNVIQTEILKNSAKFKIIGKGSSNGIAAAMFARTPEVERSAQALRLKLSIPPGAIVFTFVGRLNKDKGIVELVEAFSRFKSTNSWLLLVGSLEPSLDPLPPRILQELKDNPRIHVPGFQPDILPWFGASDIFVFPSYREGFPNVVMQAACMGIPCVVSDINGNNEIIEDKVSGLLVKPRDTAGLEEAMKTLANDPVRRRAYAEQAKAYVTANFDNERLWAELLAEYTSLLKEHSNQMARHV